MEISLIDKFDSHINKNGYNVTLGGDGYLGVDNHGKRNPMYGRSHSEETKAKISAKNKGRPSSMKGKHLSDEARKNMSAARQRLPSSSYDHLRNIDKTHSILKAAEANSISVCQYDLNLNFINKYSSAMNAERKTGINHSNIAACCKKKHKTAGGYIWIYESEADIGPETANELQLRLENKNKLLLGKKIVQLDSNLNYINKFNSIHDAAKQTGISRRGISAACNGVLKTSGGYIWRFADCAQDIAGSNMIDNPVTPRRGKCVIQLDTDLNVIAYYVSCAEAARATGISRSCISKTCLGKQKQAAGYIWRFD